MTPGHELLAPGSPSICSSLSFPHDVGLEHLAEAVEQEQVRARRRSLQAFDAGDFAFTLIQPHTVAVQFWVFNHVGLQPCNNNSNGTKVTYATSCFCLPSDTLGIVYFHVLLVRMLG